MRAILGMDHLRYFTKRLDKYGKIRHRETEQQRVILDPTLCYRLFYFTFIYVSAPDCAIL